MCYRAFMARYKFGEPISDDDILEVQGVEYPMIPVGMRAMRRMLTLQKDIKVDRAEDEPVTEVELDLALDIVINCVRLDHREAFREHIEDSVPPNLLIQIATAVMGSFSDLDPTQPELSSGGSQPTGSDSTDGAPAAVLTPVL
jgi:hypothetical protein